VQCLEANVGIVIVEPVGERVAQPREVHVGLAGEAERSSPMCPNPVVIE
jgi:hypothetical protein